MTLYIREEVLWDSLMENQEHWVRTRAQVFTPRHFAVTHQQGMRSTTAATGL